MLVLTKCLELLCDIESPRRDIAIGVRKYARESLVFRLKALPTEDQKKVMGPYLARLLSEAQAVKYMVPQPGESINQLGPRTLDKLSYQDTVKFDRQVAHRPRRTGFAP